MRPLDPPPGDGGDPGGANPGQPLVGAVTPPISLTSIGVRVLEVGVLVYLTVAVIFVGFLLVKRLLMRTVQGTGFDPPAAPRNPWIYSNLTREESDERVRQDIRDEESYFANLADNPDDWDWSAEDEIERKRINRDAAHLRGHYSGS